VVTPKRYSSEKERERSKQTNMSSGAVSSKVAGKRYVLGARCNEKQASKQATDTSAHTNDFCLEAR